MVDERNYMSDEQRERIRQAHELVKGVLNELDFNEIEEFTILDTITWKLEKAIRYKERDY